MLIATFKSHGLTNEANEFMSSYLSGRYQRVRLSNEKRSCETLTKGIPHGSGLGPIIFNIFMNDAFYFLQKCDFVNYADDDTILKIASTMESLMECLIHDSEVGIDWFHNNFMEANPLKFQFMLLKSFTSKENLSLTNILMFYVRMQIDRLMCSVDLEMFLIMKKGSYT